MAKPVNGSTDTVTVLPPPANENVVVDDNRLPDDCGRPMESKSSGPPDKVTFSEAKLVVKVLPVAGSIKALVVLQAVLLHVLTV